MKFGNGILPGDNFTVTDTANEELAPEVAYGSGVYLVAWRNRTGGDTGDAYGQIVSPTGELAGASLVIMNGTFTQQPTEIIFNPDLEKFFVLWKDLRTGTWDTWGRHVSPDGTLGTAIQITNVGGQHEVNAAGAYNPDDQQYLIVWEQGSSSRNIEARRILISETVVTTETISIAIGGSDEREPDVVYLPSAGRYAVVWREGSTADILARLVTPAGDVDGSAFTISDNAADERGPSIAADGFGGALVVWWRDNGSGQKDLYGRQLAPSGQLIDSAFTILEQDDVQDKLAVIGAGGGRYLLAWQDDRNGSWDIYASLYQQEHNQTVITYAYDSLYRLTDAVYTGAASATYEYEYDAVGNMTSYTTTIASTTVITRTFDDANQLAVSGDGSGNTTYDYDGNGSLVKIDPPGASGTVQYGYDQRNLMITSTVDGVAQADFDYDGMNNRLRQVDYTGVTTTTITYTNDILGLSQVLIADDGTEQVVNLFGLDLIHQDDGTKIRTLLADGLGSVRLEMADGGVEAATTYSPYGDTLIQSGTSGTVYGFTGEQEDGSTGLLYLRARYYNSYLNRFMSVDPIIPGLNHPQSLNLYSYVVNNPINLTDPSGLDPWWCDYQAYPGIPSHGIQEAISDCRQSYHSYDNEEYQLARRIIDNIRSDVEGITYDAYHPTTGRFCDLFKSYVECWNERGILQFTENEQIDPVQFAALEEVVYKQLYEAIELNDRARATFDTPFFNAIKEDTNVCLGTTCFPRSHVNYFAQGAWSARLRESRSFLHATIRVWKGAIYGETYVPQSIFAWADYGYFGYLEYESERFMRPWSFEC